MCVLARDLNQTERLLCSVRLRLFLLRQFHLYYYDVIAVDSRLSVNLLNPKEKRGDGSMLKRTSQTIAHDEPHKCALVYTGRNVYSVWRGSDQS